MEQAGVVKELFGLTVELEEPDVANFIQKNINKFSKETTEETNTQLAKTLNEGIEEGDSIPELSKRVKKVFTIAIDSRAETIARTEVTRSATWTNEQIYKQAGIKAKEWFTNPGACQYCQPMHRKIIDIDKAFFAKNDVVEGDQGGELPLTYETVLRPPLHPNCRCDILPVLI